jgi:hypothetical protein
MDGTKFDQLIKSVTTTRITRLTALRGLAVGALAAIIGFAAPDEADAKKRCSECQKKKKHKSKNGKTRIRCKAKANGTLCSIGTCQNSVCTRSVTPPVGCSPANNTRGSCPSGQICNTNAICVTPAFGCTGTNGVPNTQGTCPAGQVCNTFNICVTAVGCLNTANPQCSGTNQICCPSESLRAGECRGTLTACQI